MSNRKSILLDEKGNDVTPLQLSNSFSYNRRSIAKSTTEDIVIEKKEIEYFLKERPIDFTRNVYIKLKFTEYVDLFDLNNNLAEFVVKPNQSKNNVAIQTKNVIYKTKEIQSVLLHQQTIGTNVDNFSIYDSYNNTATNTNDNFNDLLDIVNSSESNNKSNSILSSNSASFSTDITYNSFSTRNSFMDSNTAIQTTKTITIDYTKIKHLFTTMERTIATNNYAKKLLLFKQNSVASTTIPSLQFMFSLKCELVRDSNVFCISFNKHNANIIAVAYDSYVLIWNIKNIEYPERAYSIEKATCLDFSSSNPNLLAAGCKNGRIVIYDIQNTLNSPLFDTKDLPGKHRSAVWQVKWVQHATLTDQSTFESLISISSDGRVLDWHLKKELECSQLLSLKYTPRVSSNSKSTISKQAAGLCFDFNGTDSTLYLVGTDDGSIHKCSKSYDEQYLLSYAAHHGPVSRVTYSPFVPNYFLSCSSDWTIKLWNHDQDGSIKAWSGDHDAVNDIIWSPTSSTVFGCVTQGGRIEIWDLAVNALDPIVHHNVLDRRLNCLCFGKEQPVVLVGDDNGSVNVYKILKVNWDCVEGEKLVNACK